LIELNGLCAGYGRRRILHGITAAFARGSLSVIVGPNGSGKTTLLKAAAALIPAESGTLLANGKSLPDMKPKERARTVAYLAQGGRSVPDMTAAHAVLHGRFAHLSYPHTYTENDKRIAAAAMERMGVSPFADRPMAELSGGMRQNVYLAMALAQETDYIFLDEPTTYLDVANRFRLMETLRALADEGKGIVAVLHDLELAMQFADEITVIQNGICAAKGAPDSLAESGILDRVFGITLQKIEIKDGSTRYVACR